jgi:hypothetical protein
MVEMLVKGVLDRAWLLSFCHQLLAKPVGVLLAFFGVILEVRETEGFLLAGARAVLFVFFAGWVNASASVISRRLALVCGFVPTAIISAFDIDDVLAAFLALFVLVLVK